MKIIVYILASFIGLASIYADASPEAASKKKDKVNSKKTIQVDPSNDFGISYPTITMALNSVKEHKDAALKSNSKPFGWQERTGPWHVVNEGKYIEWAFTESGHYAHPSLVKRIIDVGSTDHVNVNMTFRCEATHRANCDKLLTEFKDVNKLIFQVYRKKFITSAEGVAVWNGVDSLE